MSKRFTVMVVPDRSSNTRRFRVSSHSLWILAGSLLVLLGLVTASTIRYFSVTGQLEENKKLRQQNVELKNQLVMVHEKVASIQSKMDRIQRFDAKLRMITELHDPKRHLAMGPYGDRAGEGADEARGVDPLARAIGENPIQAADLLGANIDKISKDAEKTESNIRQMEAYLRGQKTRLSSTPSISPTQGLFSSGFGMRVDPYTGLVSMHTGIDIANEKGTPIISPAQGVVTFSGTSNSDGYGRMVLVDHGFGLKTRYAHLSETAVRAGDRVERGQKLGNIGNSGRSTGSHLHYEVELNGICEDPTSYILDDKSLQD